MVDFILNLYTHFQDGAFVSFLLLMLSGALSFRVDVLKLLNLLLTNTLFFLEAAGLLDPFIITVIQISE